MFLIIKYYITIQGCGEKRYRLNPMATTPIRIEKGAKEFLRPMLLTQEDNPIVGGKDDADLANRCDITDLADPESEKDHQIGKSTEKPTTTMEPLRCCHADIRQRCSRIRIQGVIISQVMRSIMPTGHYRVSLPPPGRTGGRVR